MAESTTGKVAIVTGAGSPIGLAYHTGFYPRWGACSVLDLNHAWLEQSAHEMRAVGGADCVPAHGG
jgi:NAD(P)-dependent dehydrogenase (short-subunit alcohol dehydrogenase family)